MELLLTTLLTENVGPPAPEPEAPAFDTIFKTIIHALGELNIIIFSVGGAVAVLMIIVGGIYYITGHADAGKKIIMAVIIGVVIIALAGLLVNLATTLLNI